MMCELTVFTAECDAIFANAWSDDLKNVADNVYTRGLFDSN